MAYIQFIQQVSNLTTLICPPRYVPQLTTELGQQVFPRYYVPYVTQAQNLDSQSESECQGAEGGRRGEQAGKRASCDCGKQFEMK